MSPLSLIYGAATQIRNTLYDGGVLKSRRLSRPVVSVGNLSMGGAGKTPFVLLLGELLKSRNIRFDVLSRGYGRGTSGVLAVDPNGSPDEFGDEPLLLARRLASPVVVGEDRYHAGVFAEEKFSAQVHFLDDGFQHRSLARDFDIVMLTSADIHDRLLPKGRLREPLSSLSRADAVVLSGEFNPNELPSFGKRIWRLHRGISIAKPPTQPIVFCGIARPRVFLEQLRHSGVQESSIMIFPDHHRYSDADIGELIELRGKNGANGFITTEKDTINLGPLLHHLGDVAIARVTMELEQPDGVLDTLLAVIAERKASS